MFGSIFESKKYLFSYVLICLLLLNFTKSNTVFAKEKEVLVQIETEEVFGLDNRKLEDLVRSLYPVFYKKDLKVEYQGWVPQADERIRNILAAPECNENVVGFIGDMIIAAKEKIPNDLEILKLIENHPKASKELKIRIAQERLYIELFGEKKIDSKNGSTSKVCQETLFSYQDLLKQAAGSKDIIDFLRRIPDGAMQTFTLVHDSQSTQKGEPPTGVSPMWPRVIRTTADGKLTFAYTCNPDSKTYNNVEIIRWDEGQGQFLTSSIRFNPDGNGQKSHVEESPDSCIACHGVNSGKSRSSDPKREKEVLPNWGDYAFWEGVYGANDDVILDVKSFRRTKNETQTEYSNLGEEFLKFRKMQENNPCYALLPWLKEPLKDRTQRYYPYATTVINPDYTLRPNLRITKNFSALMARSLALRLLKEPGFKKIMLEFMFSRFDCGMDFGVSTLSLDSLGDFKAFSITEKDFNINFRPQDIVMNSGDNFGRSILDQLPSVLFSILAESDPQFKEVYTKSFEDLNIEVRSDRTYYKEAPGMCAYTSAPHNIYNQRNICDFLKKRMNNVEISTSGPCVVKPIETNPVNQRVVNDLSKIHNVANEDNGKVILHDPSKGSCSSCHYPGSLEVPQNLQIFARNNASKEELEKARKNLQARIQNESNFLTTIRSAVESGDMPPGGADQRIDEKELDELMEYIRSLSESQ